MIGVEFRSSGCGIDLETTRRLKMDKDTGRVKSNPEAGLARWKLAADAPSEKIRSKRVNDTEAKNHSCIHNNIAVQTVLTNDGDIDAVMFCDTVEKCIHTFIASLVPLW